MAYSQNFPAQRPVFQFNADAGRVSPNMTFSRADSPIDATKAAASAVHFWSNEKHLSSENLLTPSTPDSSWVRARLTPTYSQTGPYTGANATLHTEQAVTNTAYLGSQNYTTVANTSYTYSVWVKQNTGSRNYYQLRVGGLGTGVPFVTYHLSGAGSIDEFGGSYLDSYSITAGPTGWYKLTMTITPTSAATTTYFFLCVAAPSGGEIPSITGDTGNSFLVFGAQVSSTGETVLNETTTSIHRQYASTLKSVSTAGQPRFEYDPTDGQSAGTSLGCLIEGQSTNLLKESTDFSGSWQIINATKSLEAIAPNGALNAIAFREGTNSDQKRLLRYFDNAGPDVTISIYAKLLGNTRRLVIREANATGATAWFDLVSATASSSGVIQSVGGGWYRCSLTIASSSTPMAAGFYIVPANGTLYTDSQFAGDGYSGLLLAMPQAEQQSWASSWISTTSSTATRASDSLSVTTADIPGFSEGVGTVVYETGGVASGTATNQLAFGLRADSANFFTAGVNNGGVTDASVRVYSKTSDGDQAFLNPGTATVGTGYKLACRYELDNIAASMNGGTVVSDTSGKVPVGVDTLWVGELDGNYHLNSNIKRIAVYNEALSDTNLQALTS